MAITPALFGGNAILSGRRAPSKADIRTLADRFKVSADLFLWLVADFLVTLLNRIAINQWMAHFYFLFAAYELLADLRQTHAKLGDDRAYQKRAVVRQIHPLFHTNVEQVVARFGRQNPSPVERAAAG